MFRKDEFELVGVDVGFWILFLFGVVCCPLSYVSVGLSLFFDVVLVTTGVVLSVTFFRCSRVFCLIPEAFGFSIAGGAGTG